MYDVLIILLLFPIFLAVSYITKKILLCNNLGPFRPFINALRFIGVVVHELSHFGMCLLVGVRPTGFSVKLKSEYSNKTDPHGYITHDTHNLTFLQDMLIALAPLFVSTWLFFLSLEIAFATQFNPFIRVLAGFFCLTLFLGATPSTVDLRSIYHTFKDDPGYSCYQIALVILSGFLVLILLAYYRFVLLFDLLYFILTGIGYGILKYSFMGFNRLLRGITAGDNTSSREVNYKRFTRRRFKPTKPRKLGIEEAHW